VGDIHRILFQGGVFLYPGTIKKPEGKLRLLYESAPLAFLMEQAGGRASTGTQDILDVVPQQLHARSPLVIGSRDDVALVESFIQERSRLQSDQDQILASQ
jgi:fructose-1,6-bisphosphatase I